MFPAFENSFQGGINESSAPCPIIIDGGISFGFCSPNDSGSAIAGKNCS
jgi:hypothetical protein